MVLKVKLFSKLRFFFENKIVSLFLLFFTVILLIIHLIYLFYSDNFMSFYDNSYFHLIIILFYFILFFIRDKNKFFLKNKIFLEIKNYLLFIYLFAITFYISFTYNYFELDTLQIFEHVLDYAVLLVLFLFLVNFILGIALKKHILDRFEIIHDDIEEIKYGNISKRISIFGVDEIDRTFYFVNDLLDELEKKIDFEKKFALIDPLTKCFNRRGLDLNFKTIKLKSTREKINISMLMVDLDDFKHVNDKYGHDVGDDVLVEFSKLIRDTIRPTDSIYRLGGEEFAGLLMADSQEKIQKSVERVRESIEALKIEHEKSSHHDSRWYIQQ